jgi:hypothetical protein
MKQHAGAYLDESVASELKLGWRVGRWIKICVRVVPARDRCGADIVNVEIRAENLQDSVPWLCSKSRARESRRFAQQGQLARPNEALTRI